MQYDPDDLIIVRCTEGHEHQMMAGEDTGENCCPACGAAVQEVVETIPFTDHKEYPTKLRAAIHQTALVLTGVNCSGEVKKTLLAHLKVLLATEKTLLTGRN